MAFLRLLLLVGGRLGNRRALNVVVAVLRLPNLGLLGLIPHCVTSTEHLNAWWLFCVYSERGGRHGNRRALNVVVAVQRLPNMVFWPYTNLGRIHRTP